VNTFTGSTLSSRIAVHGCGGVVFDEAVDTKVIILAVDDK
jgi:hypothetical protein